MVVGKANPVRNQMLTEPHKCSQKISQRALEMISRTDLRKAKPFSERYLRLAFAGVLEGGEDFSFL